MVVSRNKGWINVVWMVTGGAAERTQWGDSNRLVKKKVKLNQAGSSKV